MTNTKILALGLVISVGVSQAAFADSEGAHDSKADKGKMPGTAMGDGDKLMGMMGGDMMPMMQKMMKMHASMMRGKGGMMDRDMMSTMMSGGQPHEMPAQMAEKMREFDADSDGALTLSEFEALHMSAVRARMVDRFQHLDADGDGQITQEEMEDADTRMSKMKDTSGDTDTEGHHDSDSE